MDKKKLLQAIENKGLQNTFGNIPEWRDAFEAYHKATGKKLSNSCSSCYREVLNWLRS